MTGKKMDPELGFVEARRLSGLEPIRRADGVAAATVLDFWQWSSSDLVDNVQRGVYAEFLVGLALAQTGGVRSSWDAFDIKTAEGVTVEVKSCAYLQAWPQRQLTSIRFGIGRRLRWEAETDSLMGPKKRQASVYVFCLLAHKDQQTLDPLDLRQWEFFVLATKVLDKKMGDRQQIGLVELETLGARKVGFEGIAEAVRAAGGSTKSPPGT